MERDLTSLMTQSLVPTDTVKVSEWNKRKTTQKVQLHYDCGPIEDGQTD